MDIKELRKKSEAELDKFLQQQREVMRDLRFKVAAKQHKDVRNLRDVKHDIARILTVLKEKAVVKAFHESKKPSTNKK